MTNKKKKAPTVYDVAKLAGVSPSTVSRFLNRTTYVGEEKSHKIEQAITTLATSQTSRCSRIKVVVL